MLKMLVAVSALLTVLVAGVVLGLGLPIWTLIAFAASFPLYYFGLASLAAWKLEAWMNRSKARIARGELPPTPLDSLPEDPILRWYYPKELFAERIAALLSDHQHWTKAAEHYEEAYRQAPEGRRAEIARLIWTTLRKLRGGERTAARWAGYLEDALSAPEPPCDLYQDYGDALLARNEIEGAHAQFEKAFARAETDGQRFKILCKLAVATVRSGRFGAADGYLHEAHEMMPSGDPGYHALYDRTVQQVADARHAHAAGGGLNLVQLAGMGSGTNHGS